MGAIASAARDAAEQESDEAERQVAQMMQVLQNKLEAIELQIERTRGETGAGSMTEVGGGRTVMRQSEIRVSTNAGVSEQIKVALGSFFQAAQGSASGDSDAAKKVAIEGAENLLSAGIDALFGVQSGQGAEKRSFVVLFMNNAFVRVDYFLYTYSISAQKWGAEANRSGCCYVADLSVLNMADLKPSEIDFLISQALSVQDGDFDKLMKMKVKLIEVGILSKALENENLTFSELEQIVNELGEAQKTITEIFGTFDVFEPIGEKASTESAPRRLPTTSAKKENPGNVTFGTPRKQEV